MTSDFPSLADIQALSRDDLEALVVKYFHATRRNPRRIGTSGRFQLQEPDALGVVVRAPVGGSPLAGVVLTAVRRDGQAVGANRAVIVTTGTYTVSQQANLERAIELLRDFDIDVIEGSDLLAWLQGTDDVRREFFPTREDVIDGVAAHDPGEVDQPAGEADAGGADATKPGDTTSPPADAASPPADAASPPASAPTAYSVPPTLLAVIDHLVPQQPVTANAERPNYWPLFTTVLVLAFLIAYPIEVGPHCARWIGAIGLGMTIGIPIFGLLLSKRFDRPSGLWRNRPLRAVLFAPDRTTLLRNYQQNRGVTAVLWYVPAAIVALGRRVVQSALGLFFAFFASAMVLLWGFDSAACNVGSTSCAGAFAGAGTRPSVGDFLYLAAHGAVLNQPADLAPVSRVARALITVEFIAAASLIGSYAAMVGMSNRADGDPASS